MIKHYFGPNDDYDDYDAGEREADLEADDYYNSKAFEEEEHDNYD